MELVHFILGSLPLLIHQYVRNFEEMDLKKTLAQLSEDLSLPRIQSYDYIIVGAGSAGCIMASRLSEKFKVLLLESGGNPPPSAYTQYLLHIDDNLPFDPSINDVFNSTQQEHFALGDNGIYQFTSGRMMGGSSSHNVNIYNRGSPYDFDSIANLTQDHSWLYRNVLKYFKKLENYAGRLVNEGEREEYYGLGGPIDVATVVHPPRLLPHWLQAGQELGFKVADPNGHQSVSFTPMAHSMSGGVKDNSYISYIKPIEERRETLTVLRYSNVEKVLISEGNTAYGVQYRRHGIPQIAHATKQVIISAGVISSPLLLIKSGIGPKELLTKAQIPVVCDVPGVGQNLRDHCQVDIYFNINNGNHLIPRLTDRTVEDELARFHTHSPVVGSLAKGFERTGIFAIPMGMAEAFISSSRAKMEGEPDWPDLMLSLNQIVPPTEKHRFESSRDFMITIGINRQRAVGELVFNTSAYVEGHREDTKLALVNPKFFTDRSDISVLTEGINLTLRLMEDTNSFRSLGATYYDFRPNNCKHIKFRSDSYWECHIKNRAHYSFHGVGTAKMGSSQDTMAVVDSRMRVRGVQGLMVVDASVLPIPPNTNTNAGVMMLAEKAASEILSNGGNID